MILNVENLRKDFKRFRKKDEKLSHRLSILIEFTKIEIKHLGNRKSQVKTVFINSFLLDIGYSIKTIQRWKKLYSEGGYQKLKVKTAPGRTPNYIRGHVAKLITQYRIKKKWGALNIKMHLLYDHGICLTKFRIERFLTTSGLRDLYPCTTAKKKLKSGTVHIKKVVVNDPGAHTQIDTKFLPYLIPDDKRCVVYNFIDHASNWSFKKSYQNIGYKETKDFLEELLKVCPFKILRLQSDGGIEFTSKYVSKNYDDPTPHPLKEFCEKNGIRHVVIPPGIKELQGLVERAHRQDDQELYSNIVGTDFDFIHNEVAKYYIDRNKNRRFLKLNWIGPDEWLKNYNLKNKINHEKQVA